MAKLDNGVLVVGASEREDDWLRTKKIKAREVKILDAALASYEKEHQKKAQKGGPGSGHHGHEGRPGEVGGSKPGAGGAGGGAAGKPKAQQKPKEAERQLVPGLPNEAIVSDGSAVAEGHIERLRAIPRALHEIMAEKGFEKVYTGDAPITGLDKNQHLKGVTPRGWPKDETWDDSPGGARSDGTQIDLGTARGVGPQHYWLRYTTWHEYGHAVEATLFTRFDWTTLREHHVRLFDRLSPYEQQGGPGSHAGMQETFANAFAVAIARRAGDSEVRSILDPGYDHVFMEWVEVFTGV